MMLYFNRDDKLPKVVLQLFSATQNYNMSWFNSWMAGVKFLAQLKFSSSKQQQPGIVPGYQAWTLTITTLFPRQLGYYTLLQTFSVGHCEVLIQ